MGIHPDWMSLYYVHMSQTDWLTKREAAEFLGVNEKTIERLVKRKKLSQGWRNVGGGRRPMAIYSPADLKAIKEETPSGDILPSDPIPDDDQDIFANYRASLRAKGAARDAEIASWEAAAKSQALALAKKNKRATGIVEPPRAIVGPQDKLYLTLDEAVQYSGLPKTFLEGLVKDGRLRAIEVGRHGSGVKRRIRRADLEGLKLD